MLLTTRQRKLGRLLVATVLFLPLFAASYYCAFLLRFAGTLTQKESTELLSTLPWVLMIKWIAFLWFRVHRGWSRYVTFHDLLAIGYAVTLGTLAVTVADALFMSSLTIPRSVLLIDWGTTLLAVGATRALPRLVRDDGWRFLASWRGTPSLIVGANDAGQALLRYIRHNAALNHHVVGFLDNLSGAVAARIEGVPVLGTCDDLPKLVERYGIEEVLLMSGELPGTQVRRLMESAAELGFRVKVLPSFEQLLEGRVAVHPRPVAIEDLLCRPTVELDMDVIRRWIAGRVVLVTGSAGSIGSEICRQLLKLEPAELVLVDRSETGQFFLERELRRLAPQAKITIRLADTTDKVRIDTLLGETRPDIIFHAAAYKHVPLMEDHCGEAIRNIVLATRNLVDLADKHGTQAFVMISTDKAVNPTSVMGSCKRLAEQYVQAWSNASTCRLVTVRFGNVLDSAGSVVPVFREQIAAGGPVTVTHPDIIRYFMLIPEAAQLVIQAGAMGQGGEIFVLDMGEPVRIVDLAHDMIRLSGLRVGEDIEVEFVGLRPGEKLFEELYDKGEHHLATGHPKIMVVESAKRNLLEVIRDIGRLEEMLHEPNLVVKAALEGIIPLAPAAAPAAPAIRLAA